MLPPDYTRIAVRTLTESGADNVGGIMRAEGRTPFEKAVALAYGSRVGLGGTPHHVGGQAGPAETAYLGVFRRDRLFAVGLFDEGIKRGQDWELNRRLRTTGGTVWFTPGARRDLPPAAEPEASDPAVRRHGAVAGRARTTVPGGQRPAVLRATGDGRGTRPRARRRDRRCHRCGRGSGAAWALLGFVVPAVYLVFVVVGALAVSRRSDAPTRAWLLVVLPCIHIGWGVGFIVGFLTRTSELTTHTGR